MSPVTARSSAFGTDPAGRVVTRHEIGIEGGPALSVLDLGATVAALTPPWGGPSIVLGYADPAGYLAPEAGYLGAIAGRYANRIAKATFTLDGAAHHIDANEGENVLHGGPDGFDRRIWDVVAHTDDALTLRLTSPDGDQGFPGEVTALAAYTVLPDGVRIELTATTDAPTVVNLTNHSYFALRGPGFGIDDLLLTVDAPAYLPVDDGSIPLGDPVPVAGTPFDLRTPTRIGGPIRCDDPQIRIALGIDHNFVLGGGPEFEGLVRAARVEDPATGHAFEVFTDQVGLQVYTGNFLDGTRVGASGHLLRQGDGMALETQLPPDSPNRDWRPSPVLRPGETYRSVTRWRLT